MQDVDVSNVNELAFPEEYVLQGGDADITGFKSFTNIEVEKLDVSNVNSVPVGELVTLDTAQNIEGNWTVEQLIVLGDLQVKFYFTVICSICILCWSHD